MLVLVLVSLYKDNLVFSLRLTKEGDYLGLSFLIDLMEKNRTKSIC